jgi:uncharacterized protein YndB with AHSA1/START domain
VVRGVPGELPPPTGVNGVPARSGPHVIRYHGAFDLAGPPEAVWGSIEDCRRFPTWWAWLRSFRVEGRGLEAGTVLHGVVVPPVPYTMRIHVHIDAVEPPRRVDATVAGDLEGVARLELGPGTTGTNAEVWWTIEMMQRSMRVAARVAGPLMRWGHDRVVEATVAGFRRHTDPGSTRP